MTQALKNSLPDCNQTRFEERNLTGACCRYATFDRGSAWRAASSRRRFVARDRTAPKSLDRLPLPLGEVGATAPGGGTSHGETRKRSIPHPGPLPAGEGTFAAALAHQHRALAQDVAEGVERAHYSPDRLPLPLGEVGATAPGEGTSHGETRKRLIPHPGPLPVGEGTFASALAQQLRALAQNVAEGVKRALWSPDLVTSPIGRGRRDCAG